MIYEIKQKYYDRIAIEDSLLPDDTIFINTKNIVTIECYWNNGFETLDSEYSTMVYRSGILINNIKYPLTLIKGQVNEQGKGYEAFCERQEEAQKWLNEIFNEIIEIMKKEAE